MQRQINWYNHLNTYLLLLNPAYIFQSFIVNLAPSNTGIHFFPSSVFHAREMKSTIEQTYKFN